MSNLNRRQFLSSALSNLLQVAGTVTLVSAAIARAQSGERLPEGEAAAVDDAAGGRAAGNLQQKADELAAALGPEPNAESGEQAGEQLAQFLNGGWRNGGPGGRRRPWRNGPWRNGLWRNGGWRNSPWLNGGWPNTFWRNFPWNNGGWVNGGWRNW
ncbi:MAG TPA: hypothetical protein VH518_24620 [Tepidisphaeraceae bacterium]|jgi:hypothetical protein